MMRRNLNKKGFVTKRGLLGSRLRWIFISVFVLSIVSFGFLAYQYKKSPTDSFFVSSSIVKIKTWIAERKNHLHQGLTKVKQVASKHHDEQPIHFEFYTALPNMQMPIPEPVATNAPKLVVAEKAVKHETVTTPANVIAEKSKAEEVLAEKTSVVNANELEQELSQEMKLVTYIIQMGVFRNAQMASHYRDSLKASGFETTVEKITLSGKTFYRVQIGPFLNKTQVKIAERQLQKKGLNGVVRKV